MSVAVNLTRTWQLSAHIHNMCSVAREAVYTREADVKHWLERGELPRNYTPPDTHTHTHTHTPEDALL